MDILTARDLSYKIQISLDCIVREEYEVLLLKEIFESEYGSSMVFKGGTALRLAYSSPRFSEDLDFTLIKKIDKGNFMNFLKETGKKYPSITTVETTDKFYTIFTVVRFKENYLARSLSIKIEVSKREIKLEKEKDYTEKVIKSEVTPLTVLVQVATLPTILRDKEDTLKNRKAARDVFDHWYISQLLKKEVKVDFSNYNTEKAKSDLHRLLSRPYWRLVDSWLE